MEQALKVKGIIHDITILLSVHQIIEYYFFRNRNFYLNLICKLKIVSLPGRKSQYMYGIYKK